MRSSILKSIALVLLLSVVSVQSIYYAYTYDDGVGNDEHCCLVRLREDFCSATPLTSRLIQLDGECAGLGTKKNQQKYLDQVTRRVNIQSTHKIGKKVLLQLEKPLDKDILQNDLLCLSAANNNIDLDKCSIDLVNEHKTKPTKKRSSGKKEPAANATVDEEPEETEKITEVDLSESIVVRKGHGLSIIQRYELNLTNIRPKDREQRQCWSWYREQTKKICRNPQKNPEVCIELDDQRQKCVEELIFEESLDSDQQPSDAFISFNKKSKLYCENNNQIKKLLGYYRRSVLCFQKNHHIYVEHKFSDLVHLSDRHQNRDVLKFIANDAVLAKEFQYDCRDKHTLVDLSKAAEEAVEDEEASHGEL